MQLVSAPVGFSPREFADAVVFQPGGYVNISPCGLWVEAQLNNNPANGSHGLSGPCLGMDDNTGNYNWLAIQIGVINGAQSNSVQRVTAAGASYTNVFTVTQPLDEDILRLELLKLTNPNLCIFRYIRMNSSRVVQQNLETTFASPIPPGSLMGMFKHKTGSGSGLNHIAQWKNWRGGFL